MQHLAIIMDGNGRWAESKGLDRLSGHAAGAEAVLAAIESADKHNLKFLSLYSFSTENFKRQKAEIIGIFDIMSSFLVQRLLPICTQKNYRVRFVGQLDRLPDALLVSVNKVNKATLNNKGMCIVIALAYGGREEITSAVNAIIKQKFIFGSDSDLTFKDIERYLYTAGLPDPDLIVRYGGYQRLSNLYPLQSVYSELMFVDKFWPDFDCKDMTYFINEYTKIRRNFGENQ